MNKQDKIAFIVSNIDRVFEGDIDKMYSKALTVLIYDTLLVHPNDDIFGKDRESVFNLDKDYDWNEKAYREWLAKNDISHEDFVLYFKNKMLFRSCYFKPNGKNWSGSSSSLRSSLNYLLIGLVTGNWPNDFQEAYTQPLTDLSVLNIGDRTITVKYYQNERIDITGLDEADLATIAKLYEIRNRKWYMPERDYYKDEVKKWVIRFN